MPDGFDPAHLLAACVLLTLSLWWLKRCCCCCLCLQTVRFLLKGLMAVKSGKTRQQPLTGSLSYLNNLQQELGSSCSARGVDCWANPGERPVLV